MTSIFYSASTNGFYDEELKPQYVEGVGWPDDCALVSGEIFTEFALTQPPAGKVRAAGSDGLPTWVDVG